MSELDNIMNSFVQSFGSFVPKLIGALVILILGWLVAMIVAAIVRRALKHTSIDNRLAELILGKEKKGGKSIEIENMVARGIYYLIMLFVLVSFFQKLELTLITEPINQFLNQIFSFAPRLIGATFLILIAWILATVLKRVVVGVLDSTNIDESLSSQAGMKEGSKVPMSKTLGEIVYWVVFLFFLPAILDSLALQGLLGPVQGMINKALEFIPNIFAAAVILIAGWFVARIVRIIISNLLSAAGIDSFSKKVGIDTALGKQKLSGILGLLVYILILIPVAISALDALALEALTEPATNMLNKFLLAIPNIFAAIVIISIFYIIGKVVAGFVSNILGNLGFDSILVKLGLGKEAATEGKQPSDLVGDLALIWIMLFAAVEASGMLGFGSLSVLVSEFTDFFAQIILGIVILGIGLYLANLVSDRVAQSGTSDAKFLATTSKVAILFFTGAMALRRMGLANEIINMAFGLLLGAVAIAVAIAFGLGGRDVAARMLEEWMTAKKTK